ncbi:MAG: CBS domain-containing protein [Archaeoglobaceae archaeon]|nr:CBS domain-containing protein [Archaeoglobaceae archaeon]MDW8128054.1 CBS domain-containing protein [Archaeoglobaceae archaeon]
MKAVDIMNPNVIFATLPSTRENVLQLFKNYGISAVPVLKEGKITGIITRKDLLRKIDEDQVALLMTPNPVTVSVEDSVKKVVEILSSTPFRRLPVVERERLVGIITIRDIIKKIAEMNLDLPVRKYVSPQILCVWEETPLKVVGEIMRLGNAEICGVLNENEELVGIVDEKIMLSEALIEDYIVQSTHSSSSDTDDKWSWDGMRDMSVRYFEISVVKLPKEPVKKFMKPPDFVYPQTNASKCAKKMLTNDLDCIPVLDSANRVSGMVKDKDLIRVLLEI